MFEIEHSQDNLLIKVNYNVIVKVNIDVSTNKQEMCKKR